MAGEYGRLASIGIGTPQANPTVEAEMAILLPRGCSLHITRLTSRADAAEARLQDYLLGLDGYLATYDTLRPDVFGFACTGSSYLLGAREEERLINGAQQRFGYPLETASRAMAWSLERMRAKRITLVAPYPPPLLEAGRRYWSEAGFEVVRAQRIPTLSADTRGIYELTSDQLAAVLDVLPREGIDAVLISGTGLPSLRALRRQAAVPTISSNQCLAARLLDLLGRSDWLDPRAPAIRGWESRLDEALANR